MNRPTALAGNAARHPHRSRATIAALTLTVAIGAFLRLYDLDRLPGGLHFDLGANLLDVADLLDGGPWRAYFPRNNGREPFILYLQAASAALVGLSPFAARLVTAFLGILSIAATAFAAREVARLARPDDRLFVDRLALGAAVAIAGLYWSVHFSRFGLRTAAVPLATALAIGFVIRAIRRVRDDSPGVLSAACLAGAALGFGLMSYTGARLMPVAIVLTCALAWAVDRRARYIVVLVATALASAVVVSPFGAHVIRHPGDLMTHTWDTSFMNPANPGGGDLTTPVRGIGATLTSFVWRGDPNAGENLPGRPILDPIQAAAAGLVIVALVARRQTGTTRLASAIVACWLAIMSLPMALALPVPAFIRLSGAIVPLAIVVGGGFVFGASRLTPRFAPAAIIGLGLASAAWSGADYFGQWRERFAYHGAMGDKAEASAMVVSAPETRVFLAPLWAQDFGVAFLTRSRPPESFATGAGIVIPTAPASAAYYFPGEDRDAAERVRALLPGTPPAEAIYTPGDASRPLLWLVRGAATPVPTIRHALEDGIAFIDGRVARTTDAITVTTHWLAWARPGAGYTIFAQARRGDRVVAQRDGPPLDGSVPTTSWRAGDLIVDRRVLRPRPNEALGDATVFVGLYDGATGRRLRLLNNAAAPTTTDEIPLPPA